MSSAVFAQPILPIEFEIDPAEDIRSYGFDGSFQDCQLDGIRSMVTSGDTLIITRTSKIDSDTNANCSPSVPGECLIYRRNYTDPSIEFDLVGRLNDSVVGTPAFSLVTPDDQFGWRARINGNTLAVSSRYYPHYMDNTSTDSEAYVSSYDTFGGTFDYGPEDETGAVFVYTRPNASSDDWDLLQVIYNPDPVNGERFGDNVEFHDDRLLISTSREWIPGFSFTAMLQCNNTQSEIGIYELSSISNQYELIQNLIPLDQPHHPVYNQTNNGEPIDNFGPCEANLLNDFLGFPPISRRNTAGELNNERARSIAVDDDWLISLDPNGIYIYKYDPTVMSPPGPYQFYQFVEGSDPTPILAAASSTGFVSVDIDNGIIVVGHKKATWSGANQPNGAILTYEFDDTTSTWGRTAVWLREDMLNTGAELGDGVFIHNDIIIAYSKVNIYDNNQTYGRIRMLRYLRSSNEIRQIGVTNYAGSRAIPPAPEASFYEGYILLSDARDAISTNTNLNPNTMRAIRTCPYDLNNDGILNYFDISAYSSLYAAQDPQADYAVPYGTFDSADLAYYLDLYNSGCP